jgi:hypothetical protein
MSSLDACRVVIEYDDLLVIGIDLCLQQLVDFLLVDWFETLK